MYIHWPLNPWNATLCDVTPTQSAGAAAVLATTTTTATTTTATTDDDLSEAGDQEKRISTRNHATNINTENNRNGNRVVRPSLVTDNRFDCLRKKGLNFVHLNARSIFHKVSELKLITRKYRIAVFFIYRNLGK